MGVPRRVPPFLWPIPILFRNVACLLQVPVSDLQYFEVLYRVWLRQIWPVVRTKSQELVRIRPFDEVQHLLVIMRHGVGVGCDTGPQVRLAVAVTAPGPVKIVSRVLRIAEVEACCVHMHARLVQTLAERIAIYPAVLGRIDRMLNELINLHIKRRYLTGTLQDIAPAFGRDAIG